MTWRTQKVALIDPAATGQHDRPVREAGERGQRRGLSKAADYLERLAAEWTGTECGQAIAGALRLEARNLRRIPLESCTTSIIDR